VGRPWRPPPGVRRWLRPLQVDRLGLNQEASWPRAATAQPRWCGQRAGRAAVEPGASRRSRQTPMRPPPHQRGWRNRAAWPCPTRHTRRSANKTRRWQQRTIARWIGSFLAPYHPGASAWSSTSPLVGSSSPIPSPEQEKPARPRPPTQPARSHKNRRFGPTVRAHRALANGQWRCLFVWVGLPLDRVHTGSETFPERRRPLGLLRV
jgi:hypothetical protein